MSRPSIERTSTDSFFGMRRRNECRSGADGWFRRAGPSQTPTPMSRLSSVRRQRADETVLLLVRTRCEVQRRRAGRRTEGEPPETVDLDRVAVGAAEIVDLRARGDVVRGDQAVTEVADDQAADELAEGRRGDDHAPRRVQRAVGDQTLRERTVRVEDVDESIADACFVVVVVRRLLLG